MTHPFPYRYALVAFVAAVVIFVTGIPIIHRHHRSSTTAMDTLANRIGASNCADSGYYITNKLDGSRRTIYDCAMQSGRLRCVTEENGVASDETATVRLLFQNTLGTTKPMCLTRA
jgi:hypothetical protein